MGVYDITGYTQMIESWKKLRSATEDYAISLSELKKNSYTIGFNGLNPIMICSDKKLDQVAKWYKEAKISEGTRRNEKMFEKELECVSNCSRPIFIVGDVIRYKNDNKISIAIIIETIARSNTKHGNLRNCDTYRIIDVERIRDDKWAFTPEIVPVRPLRKNVHWIEGNKIIDRINNLYIIEMSLLMELFMPTITDYTYDPDTATTTITWSDNTTTTVTAEDKATADQYTGFMTAYAKKAAGNTSRIQSIYDRALKLPEKKALAEQKAKEQEEEQEKIRENQKARKRRQKVRREARRRKEEYEKSLIREEAKRLAEKEYGVPYDKNDWLKTNEDKGHETT